MFFHLFLLYVLTRDRNWEGYVDALMDALGWLLLLFTIVCVAGLVLMVYKW